MRAKRRRNFSLEDCENLLKFCKEEKTVEEVKAHLSCSHTTAYYALTTLTFKHKVERITHKGSNKAYFKSLIKSTEGAEQVKQEKEQQKAQATHSKYGPLGKVYSIHDEGVVDKSEIGRTVVKGLSGYHPYREKRASPPVYVSGSTLA